MIHLIDGRDRDMDDPDWWKDELESIYEAFDVDDEIDIHRQDEKYRSERCHNRYDAKHRAETRNKYKKK